MDMTRLGWAGWGSRKREGTRSCSQEAQDIKGEITKMSGLNREKPLGEEQPGRCPWAGGQDRRQGMPTTPFDW